MTVQLKKLDEVYALVTITSPSEIELIDEKFAFYKENYQHDRGYMFGYDDGKTRFLRPMESGEYIFPLGLISDLQRVCDAYKIVLEYEPDIDHDDTVVEGWDDFVQSLSLPKHIEIRPYQRKYVEKAIELNRIAAVSPTGSGKSLMIYLYIRYLTDKILKPGEKIMLVVPTVDLVTQMYNHFISYGFSGEDTSTIFYGQEKIYPGLTISTWQSLKDLPEDFFAQFSVLIVDEAHLAASEKLTHISHWSCNARYRLGTTGSMHNDELKRNQIQANLGRLVQYVTTSELIKAGYLSPVVVKSLILNWDFGRGKRLDRLASYDDEIKLILNSKTRFLYITKLIEDLRERSTGTVMILGKRVEYLKALFEYLSDEKEWKDLYFITGKHVGKKLRLPQLDALREKGGTIIANIDIIGTGTDIPNVDRVALITPCKSRLKIIQLIGRGLRKSPNKKWLEVIDVVDRIPMMDAREKNCECFAYKQLEDKLSTLEGEQYASKQYSTHLDFKSEFC